MTTDELLSDLEQDCAWREAELNELVRNLSDDDTVAAKLQRRSAVALAYAHAEGFVRFSLQVYIRFINRQGLKIEDVRPIHITWELRHEFDRIRQGTADKGYKALGLDEDDKKVRKHYIETQFLLRIEALRGQDVKLKDDSLAEFGQNLDERLLRGLLYQCGLDFSSHGYANKLNGLVIRRNQIAHGENSAAMMAEAIEWCELVRSAMKIMKNDVYDAAKAGRYLKSA